MRRITATSLVAVVVTLGTTPPSNADTPRCVSRHEYDRIAKGMTMTKVHKIFDTSGVKTGLGGTTSIYHYNPCRTSGVVQVSYNARLRVVAKAGNWIR